MKRSLRNLLAGASAAAFLLVMAPAAHAGPEDLPDCTTTYVGTLARLTLPEDLVTYEPPANVSVNGNVVVGAATYVANATIDYVICVG